METLDMNLINQNRKSHYHLDRLMKEHEALSGQIEQFEKAKGLSDDDEIHLHTLKKKKLEGRDQIESILAELR